MVLPVRNLPAKYSLVSAMKANTGRRAFFAKALHPAFGRIA